MKTKLTILLINLLLLIGMPITAQVTIGSDFEPLTYSLLQIKDQSDNLNNPLMVGTANAEKGGLALPRVDLVDKYQLLPFYKGDTTDVTYKTVTKKAHTGLIVYNLMEDEDRELCLGLNQWDGDQWNCFQQKMGNAIAEITNCDSVSFYGQYLNDVSLTTANYMTIPLRVTKTGAYTITVMPDPENGYYFTATGVFLATGYYFLAIPGAGMPNEFTLTGQQGDLMKITFNGKPMDTCDPLYLRIEDSSKKPLYVMDCSQTKVRGVYKIDVPLNPNENYIEMTLNVDISAVGATYIIETNTVDGISFRDEGLLTGTVMNIKLRGYGTPNSMDDKEIIITSNSQTTVATCKATVQICFTPKKILGMGHYTTNYGYYIQNSASLAVMNKDTNFGTLESSTVKCESFEFSYINGTNLPLASSIPNATRLNEELAKNPDIIVIGYTFNFDTHTIDKLTDYLNKGGVIVMFNEYYPNLANSALAFFKSIFADESITAANRNTRGRSYRLSTLDDEILNGPFGDARGKLWGEDASETLVINGLPLGNIDVYSNATCLGGSTYSGVTMFKHKILNLFFVGDGGFLSNLNTHIGDTYADKGICPFAIDANHKPIPRTNWGEGSYTNQTIYNSIIFANVMAWAIKQAEFDGINTVR